MAGQQSGRVARIPWWGVGIIVLAVCFAVAGFALRAASAPASTMPDAVGSRTPASTLPAQQPAPSTEPGPEERASTDEEVPQAPRPVVAQAGPQGGATVTIPPVTTTTAPARPTTTTTTRPDDEGEQGRSPSRSTEDR